MTTERVRKTNREGFQPFFRQRGIRNYERTQTGFSTCRVLRGQGPSLQEGRLFDRARIQWASRENSSISSAKSRLEIRVAKACEFGSAKKRQGNSAEKRIANSFMST